MKITKQELVNIIKEEVEKALSDKGVNEVDAADRFDGLRGRTGSPQTKDPYAGLSKLGKFVEEASDLADNLLKRLELFDSRPQDGGSISAGNVSMETPAGFVIKEQELKNVLTIAEELKDYLESIKSRTAKIERSLRPRDL